MELCLFNGKYCARKSIWEVGSAKIWTSWLSWENHWCNLCARLPPLPGPVSWVPFRDEYLVGADAELELVVPAGLDDDGVASVQLRGVQVVAVLLVLNNLKETTWWNKYLWLFNLHLGVISPWEHCQCQIFPKIAVPRIQHLALFFTESGSAYWRRLFLDAGETILVFHFNRNMTHLNLFNQTTTDCVIQLEHNSSHKNQALAISSSWKIWKLS